MPGTWTTNTKVRHTHSPYPIHILTHTKGKATGGYICKGGIGEYIIDADVAGAQTSYLDVTADTDAACIA